MECGSHPAGFSDVGTGGLGRVALAWQPRRRKQTAFGLLLLFFSFLGASVGFYYRPHYFILMMPAAALLIGSGMMSLNQWLASPRFARARLVPSTLVAIAALWSIWNAADFYFTLSPVELIQTLYPYNPFAESPVIASYLADHTSPQEKIAVVGSEPQILFYADRLPATGYIYTYALMEQQAYSLTMQHEMASEIETSHPRYVVYVNMYSSWIMRGGSNMWIMDWVHRYLNSNDFEVVGFANISPLGTQFYFDANVKDRQPAAHESIVVLKRKRRLIVAAESGWTNQHFLNDDARRQIDREHRALCDIFWLKHFQPRSGAGRGGPLVQDRSVDIAGTDRAARMPCPRCSALMACVRPRRPNFDAAYPPPALALAAMPASETMFTIVPPPARRIAGRNA